MTVVRPQHSTGILLTNNTILLPADAVQCDAIPNLPFQY